MSTNSKAGAALVTGAARRIGRAIVEDLANHGWAIAIHHRASTAEAEQLVRHVQASGGKATALRADLTAPGEIARLVAEATDALGPVSGLVNNASEFRYDTLASLTPESWQAHMRINLEVPVMLAQAFARALPSDRTGAIVNIVDQRAWKPTPEYFSYTLSKSSLWSATRMLAQALAPRIRVNAIGPGPVLKSIHQTEVEFEAEIASTLLGHGTTPAEIAATVRFLLDAPSITGQMIALDAGQHLSWPFEGRPAAGPDTTLPPRKS